MTGKIKWLIFVFLTISILGFGSQITRINQINDMIAALQLEKEALLAETIILKEDIEKLNDLSYIEILARENLALIYPGERKYVAAVFDPETMKKSDKELEILD